MVERVRTDMASRARVRLLRAAPVNLPSGNHEVAAGLLVTVSAAEADRLVAAGAAERAPGGIVTKALREVVHLPAAIVVGKAAGGARRFRAVASTGAVDRAGDIVEPAGWRLENFKRNPVVLLSHDSADMPVARASRVAVEGRALMLDAEFPAAGVSPRSDQAWALIEAGLLGAVSVGFVPLKAEPRRDGPGWRYVEQELIEVSLVSTPANPEALIVPPLLAERATAKAATGRTLRRQRELTELRAKAPRRVDRAAAELAPLRRAAAPERAATLAAKAKAAGRARLAEAAAEFADIAR